MVLPKTLTLNIHFSLRLLVYLLVGLVGLVYLFISADSARAAIPNSARIIPYQGILTNSSGNYVADGNYSIVFAVYTAASGGTALWSETQTVTVTNGVFTVNIGSTDANGVNLAMDTPPYYLGVKIGTNAEMSPRILLAFSPFSFVAKNVDVAPPGVPAGGVMFFNLAACPTDWTEVTAARGRYLVGLPLSGTLAGTAGTALTNLEDRAVGQHNHAITDPGHSHTVSNKLNNQNGWGYFAGYTYNDGNPAWSSQSSPTAGAVTGITVSNTGSVAGTNAPYLQLLACQKS